MPVNKNKVISATEAKLHLGRYLNAVGYGGEVIIIEKMGEQIAQIAPVDRSKKNDSNPWAESFGMWENRTPDPMKELKKMRQYKSSREKELEKAVKQIFKKKKR